MLPVFEGVPRPRGPELVSPDKGRNQSRPEWRYGSLRTIVGLGMPEAPL